MAASPGIVYLVGAGPGDPGLITVKGLRCVEQADTVVYDSLVNTSLLRHVRDGAELVFVGKRAKHHLIEQSAINALLVERAQAGQQVVRLKGGDPCLFARGGEEAAALAEAGVPFEIVPGVTSAIAVPAYAGIPVTHRDHTSSVTFVTGHQNPRKPLTEEEWQRVTDSAGTLVFLMCAARLTEIAEKLLKCGRSSDTPCAVTQWGTLPEQRTVEGPLGDIAQRCREGKIEPPVVLVVGSVVSLRSALKWYELKPLFGQRVVATRPRHQSRKLIDLLEFLGAQTLEFPTIEIVPVADGGPLDAALADLSTMDWVVFTSVNGVDAVFERLYRLGLDARALSSSKLCAIGPATAERLDELKLRVDLVPEHYRAECIVDAFGELGDVAGKKFLLPRADIAPDTLPDGLKQLGAEVIEVDAYRTIVPDSAPEDVLDRMLNGEASFVTFTSSSTAANFVRIIGEENVRRIPETVRYASIGPTTSSTMRDLGLRVAAEAEEHTIPGLVKAISDLVQAERETDEQRR